MSSSLSGKKKNAKNTKNKNTNSTTTTTTNAVFGEKKRPLERTTSTTLTTTNHHRLHQQQQQQHHHHHHQYHAATDALNASCFTIRKARQKRTREKNANAKKGGAAKKSFRPIGTDEHDESVEERKEAMRECWRKIDATFDAVLREANLEAVRDARCFDAFIIIIIIIIFRPHRRSSRWSSIRALVSMVSPCRVLLLTFLFSPSLSLSLSSRQNSFRGSETTWKRRFGSARRIQKHSGRVKTKMME
jgi:hypothetical protein